MFQEIINQKVFLKKKKRFPVQKMQDIPLLFEQIRHVWLIKAFRSPAVIITRFEALENQWSSLAQYHIPAPQTMQNKKGTQ